GGKGVRGAAAGGAAVGGGWEDRGVGVGVGAVWGGVGGKGGAVGTEARVRDSSDCGELQPYHDTKMPNEPRTIALVSCVSSKEPHAAPARDLYTSALFRKARAYAERNADAWYILSAKYGLVDPNRV